MPRALILATMAALVLLAAQARAQGMPAEKKLEETRQKFLAGEHKDVIQLASSLLYPTPSLTDPEEILEVHMFLGAAYYEEGDADHARREFEEALKLDSNLVIGPPNYSEKTTKFFNTVKREYLERTDAARREAEQALRRKFLEETVLFDRRQFYINFIPFGAGQFQNGERGKGIAFLVGQAAFTGASLGLYTYQVLRYGFFGGKVPQDEVDTARTIQMLQIGSGSIAIGLMVWGILDAWANYQPVVSRPLPEDLKQEYLDLFRTGEDHKGRSRRPENKGPQSRIFLAPTVGPESAGLSLSVEF